jgi:hypothetical protein
MGVKLSVFEPSRPRYYPKGGRTEFTRMQMLAIAPSVPQVSGCVRDLPASLHVEGGEPFDHRVDLLRDLKRQEMP